MRRTVYELAGLGMLAVLAAVAWLVLMAGGAGASSGWDRPPEHVYVRVVNPSGPAWWLEATGTGSGGESWVRSAVRSVTVDGSYLRPVGCGRTKATACVVVWPASPRS